MTPTQTLMRKESTKIREDALSQDMSDIRFEEWIKSIFDHPVADPAWYWDIESNHQEYSPSTTVQYVTRLFLNSRELLKKYSDAQVNQGLGYLVSPACSSIMDDVLDDSVSLQEKLNCFYAIYFLFRDCFAVRCSNYLSHLDKTAMYPNNSTCYMWWDVIPTSGLLQEDQAALDVMRKTLSIPSTACQESAIHGLGHMQLNYPKEVEQIINDYLASNQYLSEGLQQYALNAKAGNVQ
jgi:hypothetical protein